MDRWLLSSTGGQDGRSKDETCACKTDIATRSICNAVLGYIVCAKKKCPKEIVKKSVITHFAPNVITEAKNALWEHPLCESVVGPMKQRRKRDLEVDDIFDALDALDDKGVELGFHIPAQELDYLPALNPAALLPAAILERMQEMEYRMNEMQTTLSQVMADNQALRGQAQAMSISPSMNAPKQQRPVRGPHPSAQPPGQAEQQERSDPHDTLMKQPHIGSAATGNQPVDTSSWTTVVKKKMIPMRVRVREAAKNANVVVGTGGDNNLRASAPVKHLFVSRVGQTHGVDDIKMYLSTKKITARDVRKVSKDGWTTSSFRVSINKDDYETVHDASFWPTGVECREWIAFIPRNGKKAREEEAASPPNHGSTAS